MQLSQMFIKIALAVAALWLPEIGWSATCPRWRHASLEAACLARCFHCSPSWQALSAKHLPVQLSKEDSRPCQLLAFQAQHLLTMASKLALDLPKPK